MPQDSTISGSVLQSRIVHAPKDAAMLVASHSGQRFFTLHKSLNHVEGGVSKRTHKLNMKKGEVRFFIKE